MVDELAESDIFDGIVERRLQSFDNKATKLYAETASLHEAAQQLRDVYQAKIDIRQNKVMSILTIVTTIFMPLTLIVRAVWYERENAGSGLAVQLSDHYFSFDRSDNYRNPHFQEEKVVLMHIGHRLCSCLASVVMPLPSLG